MKRAIVMMFILMLSASAAWSVKGEAPQNSKIPNDPVMRPDGGKWRIAYCESESFSTYTKTLEAIVRGFGEMGWIDDMEGFEEAAKSSDSRTIWEWLSANEVSPYIEFVDDAFYNIKESKTAGEDIVGRLQSQDDIDAVIAMGAKAGYVLSNSSHDANVFVFAASNAVRSGIIDSENDSGKDNVWAHMDERRFERQIKAFYDIVNFKKLGMVYEDSDAARVYSAVSEVESLAKEKGFEIVEYHVEEPKNLQDYPRYYAQVEQAYRELSQQADAVYVTIASLENERLQKLFEPFYEQRIPVFSQLGSEQVNYGALMSVSVMDEVNIGRFGADNIAKCFNGAKPRELEQTFQSAPLITLNAQVAKTIGFKLPFELVIVVDEAYQSIGKQ